ncbi:hypothetical protein B9Z19DRAFT_1064171 [Tuber borchii]|uniref:Uncharacterized protein n=1 Tax=Tuber borchii TaxID=42251 RepID=A0A2T6ZVM3_TUBBO|nr:hypothetical protein B9Z19DRAFT_1064171 [Tuber borchii]
MDHAEVESGGGIKIPLKRYVSSGNLHAYRRLSGLIGFRRPLKFGLYRPRPFLERPSLARPTAYRPAYERPGPLGTLAISSPRFPTAKTPSPPPRWHGFPSVPMLTTAPNNSLTGASGPKRSSTWKVNPHSRYSIA